MLAGVQAFAPAMPKAMRGNALDATVDWVAAEVSVLGAKEYYQERRLKDLGLDTDWTEDEGNQWTGARGTAW